jgi:fermentation-respiration switch protein FrsA (DUF1100 family)
VDKRKAVKRIGWSLLAIILVIYVGLCLWFKVNERKILYAKSETVIPEDSLGLNYEEISIQSSDSTKLFIAIFHAQRADTTSAWILYFHSAGGFARTDIVRCQVFHELGFNVLAVRYRGYERSTGEPSESALYADAETSYRFLRTVKNVPATNIVLYGHSIGTGIAVEIARKVPAAGLVLEGAFTSMAALYWAQYPYFPWSLITGERYESIQKIGSITMPKIIIHASDDKMVPIGQGRDLFAKAIEPKSFLEIKGGHNRAPSADREKYAAGLSQFLQKVLH